MATFSLIDYRLFQIILNPISLKIKIIWKYISMQKIIWHGFWCNWYIRGTWAKIVGTGAGIREIGDLGWGLGLDDIPFIFILWPRWILLPPSNAMIFREVSTWQFPVAPPVSVWGWSPCGSAGGDRWKPTHSEDISVEICCFDYMLT